MSERSLAAFGAVVVLLAGGAAYVGARLAPRDAAPVAEPPAPADLDPATRAAFDRRIGYLEKRIDALEEALRNQGETPRSVALAPTPGLPDQSAYASGTPKPAATDPTAPAAPTGGDDMTAQLQAIYRTTSRTRVVWTMALFADATNDSASNRAKQAMADADTLMAILGLRDDALRDGITKVFRTRWDDGARDIGPIVRDGLERADVATVRARLHDLDAETDRGMRALFDDPTWKRYEEKAAAARQTTDSILGDFEKARLSGK